MRSGLTFLLVRQALQHVQSASQQGSAAGEPTNVHMHQGASPWAFTLTLPFSVWPEACVSLLEVSSSPERAASPDKLLG